MSVAVGIASGIAASQGVHEFSSHQMTQDQAIFMLVIFGLGFIGGLIFMWKNWEPKGTFMRMNGFTFFCGWIISSGVLFLLCFFIALFMIALGY